MLEDYLLSPSGSEWWSGREHCMCLHIMSMAYPEQASSLQGHRGVGCACPGSERPGDRFRLETEHEKLGAAGSARNVSQNEM